ncbi:MAG: carbon-nitrogen hydrolase family protein [Azoarcus sp.]|jgi:nitrilase|nr:carbon-nitrogen hydrolase family protein [Azoarcus sp.]
MIKFRTSGSSRAHKISTIQQTSKIAALQTVSGPDVEANLAVADELIAEAAARGARMVALPEHFALMLADETAGVRVCEREGCGPIQDFLGEAAARHGVWIVGGTLPLAANAPDKTRNAALVFDDCGNRVARYDKIHLFGFKHSKEHYDEAASIEPGEIVVCFNSPVGRVGLAVCYDLRFPELFRAMGKVDLIVLPAAFTHTTGRAHWETLLRARAIENQCYLAAAAQGGKHPHGRRTWGHSMIVDPWGDILSCRPEGAGIVMGEIDPSLLSVVRRSLPALDHRRPELF